MLTIKTTILASVVSSILFGCGGESVKSPLTGEDKNSPITTLVDKTAPIITLLGKRFISIRQGSIYTDAGATANDNKDGNVSANIRTSNPVDTSTPAMYTITYNVKDASHNSALEIARTVTVTPLIDKVQNYPPKASNVQIVGTAKVGETLTLNYIFNDEDSDTEGKSIIAWSTPTKELQRGESKTFKIPAGYEGDTIGAWVHPVDEHNLEGDTYAASNNMLSIQKSNMESPKNNELGAQSIQPTLFKEGTIFVSPTGIGSGISVDDPASLNVGLANLKEGSVLFLRNGTYTGWSRLKLTNVKGTAENPIIIESYPGEKAIIDGEYRDRSSGFELWKGTGYIYLRNLEITRMQQTAIQIKTSNNKVEGCTLHDNHLSGVHLMSTYIESKDTYTDGNNIIRNNVIYNNSDAGLSGGNYNDGDNADGIAISSGINNKILHNTIHDNSDDGIDTWQSDTSEIAYNLVYKQGKGAQGNGNGIKLGGFLGESKGKGVRAYAHHNVVYQNKSIGFDLNAGKNVRIEYNTSYKNNVGYSNLRNGQVTVKNNISYEDTLPPHKRGTQESNSWQLRDEVIESNYFKSLDPTSSDFLKPSSYNFLGSIGAYAKSEITLVPLFLIGDSTVDNYTTRDKKRVEMGWGNVLEQLMINPNMKYNHARSGSSSLSYTTVTPTWKSNGFWGDGASLNTHGGMGAKQRIIDTDTIKGGFLLIQFGHNDAANGSEINATIETVPEVNLQALTNAPSNIISYESNLRRYIEHAFENNVIPVLITSVSRMIPYALGCPETEEYEGMSSCPNQHIYDLDKKSLLGNPFAGQVLDYPKAMKSLQKEYANQGQKVILLDLTNASMKKYRTIIEPGETKATQASVREKYAYDDFTHFNPLGTKMVAGLIKMLACEQDQKLCAQFK